MNCGDNNFRQTGKTRNIRKLLVGKEYVTNEGLKCTVIEYNGTDNVLVEFEDGYRTTTRRWLLDTGKISNPNFKSVYGVGYLGVGEYKNFTINGDNKIFKTWQGMLQRCYDEKLHKRYETYVDCTVCEEWHNFQNFAKWYKESYYEIDGEMMCLDKDIIAKGNKVYSPETCVFVPRTINICFTKTNKLRGDFPIGVRKVKEKYGVTLSIKKKKVTNKTYKTPQEAFDVYKELKEKHIKNLANQYKEYIPQRLYDAMMNYKVEITD